MGEPSSGSTGCDESEETDPSELEWPEYVCVRDIFLVQGNSTIVYDGDVDFNMLIGGYKIDYTENKWSDYPQWIKPPNDYNENETFIYYDEFMGYWQIGQSVDVESQLFCQEDAADDYLPTHCKGWYDEDLNVLANMFLYTTNCDADDVMKMTVDENGSDTEDAVIAVVVILVIVLCGVGIWVYFKKLRGDKGAHGFSHAGATSPDNIELGDDVDRKTLVAGNGTAGGTTGGFDMSPLNPNDVDDDEDELTDDDGKGHGIVDGDDDGDDEEQLIGNGTTQGDDDVDLELPS